MSRVYLFLIAGFLVSFISCEPAEINYYEFIPHDLNDGVYEGYAENKNKARVELHIDNHKIIDVIILELEATKYGSKAEEIIPNRIIEEQTPFVDAVTGATEASHVIINATVDALLKAKSE